jgi:methyl-accepting chemotaxis protein
MSRPFSRSGPLASRINMHTLRFRLVVTVLIIVSSILLTLIALFSVRTSAMARENAEGFTRELAGRESAQVSQQITGALDTVRAAASVLGTMRTSGAVSRAEASAVIRDLLAKHPEFVGASTGWEPNAFDGQDKKYAGTANHDSTGRFIPYWYHENGALKSAPLTDYETPGAGDWYLVPRKTGKETVVDPYLYRVGNEDILMTTAVAPIIVRGSFVGVVTADLGLKNLSQSIGRIRPFGTGYAALVATSGSVVAHPDGNLLGKSVQDAVLDRVKAAASSGSAVVVTDTDTHLGQQALTVYQPVRLGTEATWMLVLSAPTASVQAEANSMRSQLILLAVAGLLVAAVLAWITAQTVMRPIAQLRDRVTEASRACDLTQRLDESRKDEVGELGAAFNRFTEMTADLVRQIKERATELTASAERLGQVSARLSDGAQRTATKTAAASATVGVVSESINRVATGVEQMGVSINDIAASVADAATVGGQAVETARETETSVTKLGDSSAQIGEVVKVITTIAEQTNLLALNATIEAARAGDAGKGFAVVASEVKDLAQETAQATERIAGLVFAIQADTVEAVDAIGHISQVIGHVNESQNRISSAVQQQTVTAGDMSGGAVEAATRAAEVADVVGEVATGTEQTTQISAETGQAATELATMASDLQRFVGHFRVAST